MRWIDMQPYYEEIPVCSYWVDDNDLIVAEIIREAGATWTAIQLEPSVDHLGKFITLDAAKRAVEEGSK